MTQGYNHCTFIGNLGRDPDLRYSQGCSAVCKFAIAVNERRKDGDDWKDHVEWINVVCFGNTAENAGKYLAKGRPCFVEGRMQSRSWDGKDGTKKYITEIVAFKVLFLGGGGSSGTPYERHDAGPTSETETFGGDTAVDDGDMPF